MEAKKQKKLGHVKFLPAEERERQTKTDDRIINEYDLFFTIFLRRKDITVIAGSDTM